MENSQWSFSFYWFIFHISDREQLTDRPLAPTFYLGNCPYCSCRGFHLFSYFTFISGEQTVLFDPRRRMVLAGILSCVPGHRQSGTFKRLMLTFHIVYLLNQIGIKCVIVASAMRAEQGPCEPIKGFIRKIREQ